MIDLYCERVGPGLFGEPLNASSNVFFLIAAWRCRQLPLAESRNDAGVLAGTLVAIGLGSGLFHTCATAWAELLDVLPLVFFQVAYLWLHLRGVVALDRAPAAALVGGFFAAIAICALFPDPLNGSLAYAPAAATLLLISARQHHAAGPGTPVLIAAALVFVVSLAARTADNFLCPRWPWGTHFVWHMLNALALYLLVRAYLTSADAGGPPTAPGRT